MQARAEQRLRITFSKTGATRFIGHLDLARTLERAFNRAVLPVQYSQGFNRRPKMQFAAALPLGFSSSCELVDIWLSEAVDPEKAGRMLADRMAPGISIHKITAVPLSAAPLQTLTREASYEVAFLDPIDLTQLKQRVHSLLASATHIRTMARGRKKKLYDLRPLILDIAVDETSPEGPKLQLRLCLKEAKNGRPDELLRALEMDPLAVRIERTSIVLAQSH